MEDCSPFFFIGSWALVIFLGFEFLIDPFWKNMFIRLKGVCTYFNHTYVQREMSFLL
jgi:hypothetical protein